MRAARSCSSLMAALRESVRKTQKGRKRKQAARKAS